MPSNWKFPSTSFQGDGAHGSITHRSINVAAIGPQGDLDEDGIPVAVLAKKSAFTAEEEATVRRHLSDYEPLKLLRFRTIARQMNMYITRWNDPAPECVDSLYLDVF